MTSLYPIASSSSVGIAGDLPVSDMFATHGAEQRSAIAAYSSTVRGASTKTRSAPASP